MPDSIHDQLTVEVIVPSGYQSVDEFLKDCGIERAPRPPVASTPEMWARIRELAKPERDDFDRAVLIIVSDLERVAKRYGL